MIARRQVQQPVMQKRGRTQVELQGKLEAPEMPELLHPRMADIYREKVSGLCQALEREDSRLEAMTAIRGLMKAIPLAPDGEQSTLPRRASAYTSLRVRLSVKSSHGPSRSGKGNGDASARSLADTPENTRRSCGLRTVHLCVFVRCVRSHAAGCSPGHSPFRGITAFAPGFPRVGPAASALPFHWPWQR